jgi:hypothetical protein
MMDDDSSKKEQQGPELGGGEPGGSSLITSQGVDVARAYVGPTAVPVSPTARVDDPKVKVTDPRRIAATMKISRSTAATVAGGPKPGSIDAPEKLPPGAFQPIAVDPELVQEWMAQRGKGGEAAPPPTPGDAANDTGDTSRWATTEKIERIDRRALPSSLAPRAVREGDQAPELEGEGDDEARAKAAAPGPQRVWLPIIVTVSIGLAVGLLVIKFFLLPAVVPGVAPPSSAVTAGPAGSPGRVETTAPQAPSAMPAPPGSALQIEAPMPSGEPSAAHGDSSNPPLPPVSAALPEPSPSLQAPLPSPFPVPARPKPSASGAPTGVSTGPKPPATTQSVPPAPPAPSSSEKPNVIF